MGKNIFGEKLIRSSWNAEIYRGNVNNYIYNYNFIITLSNKLKHHSVLHVIKIDKSNRLILPRNVILTSIDERNLLRKMT